jgi:hypothetical protein
LLNATKAVFCSEKIGVLDLNGASWEP